MKQSVLCRICSCERYNLEQDGYIIEDRDIRDGERYYYYRHCSNNNRISIVLNLNLLYMRIFKNGRLIKEYK